MRVAAVLLVLAACEKSEPTPTPTPPSPVPIPVTPDATTLDEDPRPLACESIEIRIIPDGLWISAADVHCAAPRVDDKLDFEWLEAELVAIKAALHPDCKPSGEVVVDPKAAYQDVVHAMDSAIKSGVRDIALTDDRAVPAGTLPVGKTHCPKPRHGPPISR